MDNLNKSRILSFEDFVTQGLDNQPEVDANIHMDGPDMGQGQLELPAPAQEPMGNEMPQGEEPNLMMMDEPADNQEEPADNQEEPAIEEEPTDSDNAELM
jgi:hypothetical protein